MISNLFELNFRCRLYYSVGENKNSDFYELWQQHKQLKIMEMSEAWPDIYDDEYIHHSNPHIKFFSSSRSMKFKNIFPWNISQMIKKTVPSSTRIIISYVIKQGIPFEFDRKSMEAEATTWSELPIWGKDIVEQALASEEINKSKRAGQWESQSGICKVNHLSKVIWD